MDWNMHELQLQRKAALPEVDWNFEDRNATASRTCVRAELRIHDHGQAVLVAVVM